MESAKVQKVQQVSGIMLMLEIESINDKIPLNTPFELNGVSISCLRKAINNYIINYAGNHLNPQSILSLKKLYEDLTGRKIEVTDLKGSKQGELVLFLNELQEAIPANLEVTLLGKEYRCLKTVVRDIKEGYTTNPSSLFFQARIRELFDLLT